MRSPLGHGAVMWNLDNRRSMSSNPISLVPARAFLAGGLLLLALLAASSTGVAAEGNPHGDLDLECSDCHTIEGWAPLREELRFDHSETGFPLVLSHEQVACTSCHERLVFAHVPTACADCHDDPHRGELGFGCEECHAPAGWDNRRQIWDVHSTTLFPLTGVHATLDCASCHVPAAPMEYASTPVDCFNCHVLDYQATTEPNHITIGFPTECELCHTSFGWSPAKFSGGFGFDHDSFYPLTGGHRGLDCFECHADGFVGTTTDCFACHRADYEATDDPDHAEAGFPTDCEACHTTNGWEGADFDHDLFFRLTGAHRTLDCEECHEDGFAGTPTDCFSCHRADYNSTEDPDHREAGISTDCEDCHGTSSWEGAVVDHDEFFRLTGSHRGLDCEDCHADGFAGTPTNCNGCHRADYNATSEPDHEASGFSRDCELCHNTRNWEDAELDHDSFFRLTGKHRGLDCEECHADGFAGTPDDCYSCHRSEYQGTTDPDHADAGFPTSCEACHNTNNWGDAELDHDQFFQLTGAHRNLDCDACHAEGFPGTPTDCFSCHEDDYNSTTDPDHAEAGFPTDCEACHNTSNWGDAEFDHNQFFQLTGAHRNLECDDCHANGFPGTPTECIGCHEDDYNSTNDPDHQNAGFPTDCELCHTTNDWMGAEFTEHDSLYFPIYSGRHNNEWDSCNECHVNPGNFGLFECIECHEHNQQDMDEEHEDVPGYVWVSTACFDCHPDGEE